MKLEGIQVVRGIAATIVAMSHIYNDGWMPGPVVDYGGFGVDLFFVISGFIMCLTLDTDKSSKLESAKSFFSKRVFRIFPIYLICAIPLLINSSFDSDIKISYYYIGNLLILPSFTDDAQYALALPPGWTLVYEMLFYYVFIVGILLFKKKNSILSFVFVFLTTMVILVNMFDLQGPRLSWVNFSFIIGHVQVLNFSLGIITYYIYKKLKGHKTISIPLWMLIFFITSLFLMVVLYLHISSPYPYFKLLAAFLIITLTTLTKNNFSQNRLGKFLLLIGNASYSIYLIHFYFSYFKPRILNIGYLLPINKDLTLNFINLILMCGAIFGGILFYKTVEKPITKFIKTKLGIS